MNTNYDPFELARSGGLNKDNVIPFKASATAPGATEKAIKVYQRSLLTHDKYINKKYKFPYNTYALLVSISTFDKDNKYAYIPKHELWRRINKMLAYLAEEYPGAKLPSKDSIKKNISLLKKDFEVVTLENHGQELVYKIKTDTNDLYFTRVYHKQIERLIICTNRNTLKTFIILKYTLKEGEYKQVTREYIASKLGISTKSDSELKKIGLILDTLCQMGFITMKEEYSRENSKTKHYYKINTYEEYMEAQRRGKTYKQVLKRSYK